MINQAFRGMNDTGSNDRHVTRARVLVLSQVFPPKPGGSGRWLWELYRRLRDIDVRVLAGASDGADAFDRASPLAIQRIPLHLRSWGVLNRKGLVDYLRALRAVQAVARQWRPSEIHCGKPLPEGALAWAIRSLTGTPYVCFAHGEELTLAAESRELRFLTRRVLHAARRVVVNSHNTKRIVTETFAVPDSRVLILHPGVDTTRFRPVPPDPECRARLGWRDRRVVLTVGALQKRKGQDMMIRALVDIRRRCPDVLYAIAGEGWERAYLDALVASLDLGSAVQFCGVPDESLLVEYYQHCDLFALPNRQVGSDIEGFGIVCLEAQAAGKPVVVGRSGGAPETVVAGTTGEVVACERPEELAAAVVDLLEDPARRKQMGEAARRHAVEQFDWEMTAARASAQLFEDASQ